MDSMAMAGNIEDIATNAPRVVRRFRRIIENLYAILALECIHAAQATDLRLQKRPELKLAETTAAFLKRFRKAVPFMEEDRVLTYDIENARNFLKQFPVKSVF